MLCRKPFVNGNVAFGCGQCLTCRISRRRLWVHRLMLEKYSHSDSCFVTLTYDEKNHPEGGSLVPRDSQLFLKSLRKLLSPIRIRYYLVGEYGEQTERPHYHLALFGIGQEFESTISRAWSKGFVYVGDLTKDSASYIAGYVTKKMTSSNSEFQQNYLKGRHPEFARMSLRPGIGALAAKDIAISLTTDKGVMHIEYNNDVPSTLLHGKKELPLGRYLKRKVRENLGFSDTNLPKEKFAQWAQEMSELFKEEFKDAPFKPDDTQKKLFLQEKYKQKILNKESKYKIFTKRGVL